MYITAYVFNIGNIFFYGQVWAVYNVYNYNNIYMQFTSSLLKVGNPYFHWKFIGMFDYKKFLCHYNLLHFFYIYIAKMKGQTQLKTLSKDCNPNAHHFWNLQKKQARAKNKESWL